MNSENSNRRRIPVGIEHARNYFEMDVDLEAAMNASMSYSALVVKLASDSQSSFTLTPRNGSGLRGPSDDEIDAAVTSIRAHIGTDLRVRCDLPETDGVDHGGARY